MATPARTVQLRSPNQVMEAYQNWENPQFAILTGKQLLFANDKEDATMEEGEQLLQQWLTWIKSGGSAAIYTLAIYKNPTKGITNATPYNGSVNFQFNEYSYSGNGGSVNGANNEGLKLILDKMEGMQLQINKLQQEIEDDDDDDDDEPDTMGQITAFISNPVIAGLLGSLIPNGSKMLKPTAMPQQNEPGNVARITGTTDNDTQKRMAETLRKLQAAVPNLPDVLDQMCKLAETNPGTFNFYMSSLMAMKL